MAPSKPTRPVSPINALRAAAIEIYMFLGEDAAAALLGDKYGVDHPSHLAAGDLVTAIDAMHQHVDTLAAEAMAAEQKAQAELDNVISNAQPPTGSEPNVMSGETSPSNEGQKQ